MAKHITSVLGLAALLGASGSAATADYVAQNAAAIVVGSIATRTENSQNVTFDLTVEQVLVGSVASGQTLHVSHAWSRGGVVIGGSPQIGRAFYGIWALVGSSNGSWDVLPVRGPDGIFTDLFWSATRTPPSFYQQIAVSTVPDAIVSNIAGAAELAGIGAEEAYAAIGPSTSAVATAVFERFASLSPSFAAIGVAGLMDRQTPDALTQFVRVWPAVSADPRRSYALNSLREGYRATDPASVQQLAALCGATVSLELRKACVRALASIHSKGALPLLGSLLSSADSQEVSQGVFGISSFVNGCPVQTRDNVASMAYLQCGGSTPYKTSETLANFGIPVGPSAAALISYWQTWWANHPELH